MRHYKYFLVTLFAIVLAATIAAPSTWAADNSPCFSCHDATPAMSVAPVDRDTACGSCHLPFAGVHPYHQSGANCGAACHPGWGNSLLSATPFITDPVSGAGFATATSKLTPASALHVIHSNPRWPAGVSTADSKCASCHATAACNACHTGAISPSHGVHSSVGIPALGAYEPWVGVVGRGVPGGDQSIATAILTESQCAIAACHNLSAMQAGAPHITEDYNYVAGGNPADPTGTNSAITLTGTWRARYGSRYSGGRMSYTGVAGAQLSATVAGSRVEIICDNDPYRGTADVLVDGVVVGSFDSYAPITANQTVVFSTDLTPGTHTITVRPTGLKGSSARAAFIAVDAFRVYPVISGPIVPECRSCHGPASGEPHVDVDHTADVAGTLDPSGAACGSCHLVDVKSEHEKPSSSSTGAGCDTCHSQPRDSFGAWNQTCSQGGCHATGSATEKHGGMATAHAQDAPVPSCVTDGCHANDLGAVHVAAETTGPGGTLTSCAVCHADGIPESKACASCHSGDPHPPGTHVVGGTCIAAGCHVSDAKLIHDSIAPTGPGCSACHTAGKTASFACRECHTAPHADENHGGAEVCGSCHSTGNLMTVHGDQCTTCHPTPAIPATVYTGCTQANCHPAAHADVGGHNTPHGDGDDCWSCHPDSSYDGGWCESCHIPVYERGLPVTTSDARASYTSYAVIRLAAVDQGESGWASGIKATYYQIDGGAVQTGGTVVVPAPTSGSKTHTLEFWSMDWNHNTEAHHVVRFSIVAGPPDTVAPVGSMTVNNGATWASSTSVNVNSAVTDAHTGIVAMRVDPGTGIYGPWIDFWPTYAITLPTGNGAKTVRAEYKDAGGNVLVRSDGITLDATPPTGSVLMNAGATYTNSLTVTLAISATDVGSGVAQMRIMDNGNWTYGAWEPYATTKSYTLHGTVDGARGVWVQFRDNAGGESNAYGTSDSIGYDPTAPTGTMTVNSGATYTSTPAVTLNSVVSDTGGSGLYQMSIDPGSGTFGSPVAYAASYPFALAPGEGLKTVRVTYTDRAGNALTRSYAITLGPTDSTPPTGSIVVNGGAGYTNTTATALTLSAVDTGGAGMSQMRFSNDSVSWSAWEAYATSKAWTLAAGNGSKNVYVQYRDVVANTSVSYSDDISLDATAPTGSIVIAGGASSTTTTTVLLTLSASDTGGSGLADMRFSNDNVTWSTWEPYATSKSWTLGAGDGTKTVYVLFRDVAGGVSTSYSDTITLAGGEPLVSATTSLVVADGTWVDANDGASGAWATYSIFVNDALVVTRPASPSTTWVCPQIDLPSSGHIDIVVDCGFTSYSWIFDERRPNTYTLELPPGAVRLDSATWTGFADKSVGWDWYDGYEDYYAGVWVAPSTIGNISYSYPASVDMTAPTGSVTLGGGAAFTNTTAAALTLAASDTGGSGLSQMRFSSDNVTWSAWEAYATSKAWTLSAGNGLKTVYVQYRDVRGNVSSTYSDSITLDVAVPTGSILVAGGAANTENTLVSLALAASDTGGSGLSQMSFSNDNVTWSTWEAYASSKAWTLTSGYGLKTVYARYRDAAGNVSAVYSDTITLSELTTATLHFQWLGVGSADLHLENAVGATIGSASVSGSGSDLDWFVTVPAGQAYYLVCDYYYDYSYDTEGGGYGIWSTDTGINPDGILSPGETVVWNY